MKAKGWIRAALAVLLTILLSGCGSGETQVDVKQVLSKPKAYVGSGECKFCHLEHYDSWRTTLHSRTLMDVTRNKDALIAEINPETASKFGLGEGDWVLIQSEKGEIKAKVHLFDGAMPNVVYLPLGFGHTAYDDFQQGKGVNPFELFDGTKDPLSGFPIWWNTRVQIKKV